MKRPHKYRAKAVICPETGDHFDSKSEYTRWCELKLLERAGQIRNLTRQPKFPLAMNGTPILIRSERYKNGRQAVYTADFQYEEVVPNAPIHPHIGRTATWKTIVEDRKGFDTAESKLRRAVFEAQYGKRIRIT